MQSQWAGIRELAGRRNTKQSHVLSLSFETGPEGPELEG
jgi:hypothetical protein